jgi:glycosyltransferase involved in cell wall biosynthesis
MLLSVIMPVYNEERTLEKVIEIINDVPIEKEVIIINDGSSDATKEILDRIKLPSFTIIHHDRNRGKGAGIQTGLKQVKGDVVIIQDADLELDPKEYLKLIQPIREGRAQVVFGSRYLGKGKVGSFSRYLANRILTFFTNYFHHVSLTDMNTCYKMFKASLIPHLQLQSNGFDIEPELAAKLLKYGGSIIEIPITYIPRTSREGKKIRFTDFFKDFFAIYKFRK